MDIFSKPFFSANLVIIFLFQISTAIDIIDSSHLLPDGSTLVSKNGSFQLGFFSPEGSTNRYLGIWYGNIPVRTVVWVANRNNPINDSSGLLTINMAGKPVLLSQNRTTVAWSATNLTKDAQDPILQILDTGNLVLRNRKGNDSRIYLWQSFDYPCDTLLPGMKLGRDLKSGMNRYLTSWKSPNDPSVGNFKWEVQLQSNNPQFLMWEGTKKYYVSGPWIGETFSGGQTLRSNPIFAYKFVSNDNEVYYSYSLKNSSILSRVVMNQTTYQRQRFAWNDFTQSWKIYDIVPRDRCDKYGLCGAYGVCNINEVPVCQCLKGFSPKLPRGWKLMDWSQGCVRDKPLNCEKEDAFVKYDGLKLPDPAYSWVNQTMDLVECKEKCSKNCSCMAYSHANFTGDGSGCTNWFNDLVDFRLFAVGGEHIFIRMSSSEIGSNTTAPALNSRKFLRL